MWRALRFGEGGPCHGNFVRRRGRRPWVVLSDVGGGLVDGLDGHFCRGGSGLVCGWGGGGVVGWSGRLGLGWSSGNFEATLTNKMYLSL